MNKRIEEIVEKVELRRRQKEAQEFEKKEAVMIAEKASRESILNKELEQQKKINTESSTTIANL